jgi:hypothetical protein
MRVVRKEVETRRRRGWVYARVMEGTKRVRDDN